MFSYLAAELKTGDLCVRGSQNCADYREQLLSWDERKPMVTDYCCGLGIAGSSDGFVKQLKAWLTQVAQEVDLTYSQNTHVVIGKTGEPVLKQFVAKEGVFCTTPQKGIVHFETVKSQPLDCATFTPSKYRYTLAFESL